MMTGSVIWVSEWTVKKMRLIDADALFEHKVYAETPTISGDFVPGFVIDRAPTIDAAPVVRCKDCSNTDPAVCLPDGIFYCNEWESTTRGHWYCCRGEKKEEVEDHD